MPILDRRSRQSSRRPVRGEPGDDPRLEAIGLIKGGFECIELTMHVLFG